jgi:clan AA aspartic protease (TIGR02281 family)
LTSANSIPRTISIPLISKSGVFEIPCKLNDLKLDFVFDTGASDISISKTELNFMLKNNYLSRKDFIGYGTYSYADGSSSRCRIINIKNVEIGSSVLYNVQASVVENQKASLLFGQTALSRYGKFEIDNKTNTLHIQVLDKIK